MYFENEKQEIVDKQIIKEQLTELLESYYNGSFSQMACDYIRSTGMTQKEVEELLETMKHREK